MSDNAVAVAVVVSVVVMVGLLLIVVAWKLLDISRERMRAALPADHPALVEMRRVVGADLGEIRRRLEVLEAAAPALDPRVQRDDPPQGT